MSVVTSADPVLPSELRFIATDKIPSTPWTFSHIYHSLSSYLVCQSISSVLTCAISSRRAFTTISSNRSTTECPLLLARDNRSASFHPKAARSCPLSRSSGWSLCSLARRRRPHQKVTCPGPQQSHETPPIVRHKLLEISRPTLPGNLPPAIDSRFRIEPIS